MYTAKAPRHPLFFTVFMSSRTWHRVSFRRRRVCRRFRRSCALTPLNLMFSEMALRDSRNCFVSWEPRVTSSKKREGRAQWVTAASCAGWSGLMQCGLPGASLRMKLPGTATPAQRGGGRSAPNSKRPFVLADTLVGARVFAMLLQGCVRALARGPRGFLPLLFLAL